MGLGGLAPACCRASAAAAELLPPPALASTPAPLAPSLLQAARAAMLPAVEISGLPATATVEELRAVCACRSAVFTLDGASPSARCLAMFDSQEGVSAAQELLHGSDWGGGTLAVVPVNNAVAWVAAEVPGVSPAAFSCCRVLHAPPRHVRQVACAGLLKTCTTCMAAVES